MNNEIDKKVYLMERMSYLESKIKSKKSILLIIFLILLFIPIVYVGQYQAGGWVIFIFGPIYFLIGLIIYSLILKIITYNQNKEIKECEKELLPYFNNDKKQLHNFYINYKKR